ncbi:hypothetical protein OBK30_01850 [Empedobacter falsenii]
MNRVNYDQTEGFPLDVNILDFGQKANHITQQLGEIIAPLAIIKGCVKNGNNVSDGIVCINGEMLPFKGGLKQDVVRIVETAENRVFENGSSKPVLITRYATFGAGADFGYAWGQFHRPMKIAEIEKRLVHVGFVQDFYGDINSIPTGWHLCDGTNGTPDLRKMFVVGYDPRDADYNAIGKTGGAKEVTLTVNQLPKHKFSGKTSMAGSHPHNVERIHPYIGTAIGGGFDGGRNSFRSQNVQTSSSGDHEHSFETNEVGGGQSHENRPPFYVLAKIMYKG